MTAILIFSSLLIILSILPFTSHQHWVFRVPEFIKLQLLVLQVIAFTLIFFFIKENPSLWYLQAAQFALIVYHVFLMMRYSKFWRPTPRNKPSVKSNKVKIISCNVYQFNTEYERFLSLIKKEEPDIFFTMESNAAWEKAMRPLEKDYPNYEKVTLENTYGMHFYTKLKLKRPIKTHYFVADDLPSMEAELETSDGYRFIFFGVHPPPPSPTEEKNSKERDGDLLCVAKKVRNYKMPVLVIGDFNNVAWARSSVLFKKTSRLIDARIGRGILATFHAKYWFFRVPLDLLFHSPEVVVDDLTIYPSVGSDHFPVGCTFHINKDADHSENQTFRQTEDLEKEEKKEVNELIEEGNREESENRNGE